MIYLEIRVFRAATLSPLLPGGGTDFSLARAKKPRAK
jgi:hypothetical protein